MYGKNNCKIPDHRKKRVFGKRGSLAVETAIFLPIFIIAVITAAWLIRMVSVSENVYHSLADETTVMAAEAKLPALSPLYKSDLKKRIKDENGKDINAVKISPVMYRIPWVDPAGGKAYTNLIGASAVYKMPVLLPNPFEKGLKGGATFLCRAFVGTDNSSDVFPFDKMEEKDDSPTVWIFPRAGERYHGENCSVIKNNPREVLLSNSVRRGYQPCSLCKPNEMSNGSLVYVFPKTGGVFHRGSCYIVDRYVIPVSEEDAKSKGYTACKICGGK